MIPGQFLASSTVQFRETISPETRTNSSHSPTKEPRFFQGRFLQPSPAVTSTEPATNTPRGPTIGDALARFIICRLAWGWRNCGRFRGPLCCPRHIFDINLDINPRTRGRSCRRGKKVLLSRASEWTSEPLA